MSDVALFNIEQLIRAAAYIDSTKQFDHGYAASTKATAYSRRTAPGSRIQLQHRKTTSRSSAYNNRSHQSIAGHGGVRTMHNEMEKTRRANLRLCFDRLKNAIPEGRGELSKNTTLQLLKRARVYILNLEDQSREYERTRAQLLDRQTELGRILAGTDGHRRRQGSGGSSSSSSLNSVPGTPESDTAFTKYRWPRRVSDSASPTSFTSSNSDELTDDVDVTGTGSETDEFVALQ